MTNQLITATAEPRLRSTLAMMRWGMQRNHCTSGRHRSSSSGASSWKSAGYVMGSMRYGYSISRPEAAARGEQERVRPLPHATWWRLRSAAATKCGAGGVREGDEASLGGGVVRDGRVGLRAR